jgi:hypothetical protein
LPVGDLFLYTRLTITEQCSLLTAHSALLSLVNKSGVSSADTDTARSRSAEATVRNVEPREFVDF